MSTVGTITPYEEAGVEPDIPRTSIASGAGGLVSAAGKKLAESLRYDEKQTNTIEKYREEERKNRLQMGNRVSLVSASVTLKLRTMETFIKSAEDLGFKLLPLNTPNVPLEAQSAIALTNKFGEKITIHKNEAGKLVVQTNSDISSVQNIVKKNSLDRVRKHLEKRYRDLRIQQRTNGEYEFVGLEDKTGPGGQAKITIQIKVDGGVKADVSNIKGKRCETIIKDIARAIEGECIKFEHKSSYYQVVEDRERLRG